MPGTTANYINLTDTALLGQLASRDELAFQAIYQRYADMLYKTAFKRLPVAHKAEDLVQEVFISLYRNRHSATKINDLRAWLFACLRNQILNEIRNFNTHKKHDMLLAAQSSAATLSYPEYDLRKLELQFHNALTLLTERCRKVFLLSRVKNLPNKKIAEQLDISIHGVEKHMTSALRILKKELGKHELGIVIFLSLIKVFYPYN